MYLRIGMTSMRCRPLVGGGGGGQTEAEEATNKSGDSLVVVEGRWRTRNDDSLVLVIVLGGDVAR
jgi:hypothetical protein